MGRSQEIEISPMPGPCNVKYWLRKRGHDPEDEALCRLLFGAAKHADHTLSEEELERLVASV